MKGMCALRTTMWRIMTILAIGISGYVLVEYLIIGANKAPLIAGKLEEISLNLRYYVTLYIHILSSTVALIIGPFTLSRKFREKNIRRHRKLGKVYALGILFGGLSGFVLAFDATGGWPSMLGFGMLSVLWLTSIIIALWNIKRKRVDNHQQWMIRNYALTFAAVTLRLWIILMLVFLGGEYFPIGYPIIAWLSWVPNLVVAELYIRKGRRVVNAEVA